MDRHTVRKVCQSDKTNNNKKKTTCKHTATAHHIYSGEEQVIMFSILNRFAV